MPKVKVTYTVEVPEHKYQDLVQRAIKAGAKLDHEEKPLLVCKRYLMHNGIIGAFPGPEGLGLNYTLHGVTEE